MTATSPTAALDAIAPAPWSTTLVALPSPAVGICALPGTSSVLLSLHNGFARLDVRTRELTALACPVVNHFGEPVCARALAAVDPTTIVVADFKHVYFLGLQGTNVELISRTEVADREAMAMSMFVTAMPDGKTAVVTSAKTIQRVERDGRSHFEAYETSYKDGIYNVVVQPDGSVIACGRDDGRIELRDPETFEVRRTLTGLGLSPLSMAFDPSGRTLVAGDDHRAMRRWELSGDDAGCEVFGPGKITNLSWLSDGSGYAATALTRTVGLFAPQDESTDRDIVARQFDTRYFTGAALVDDRFVAVLVEEHGVWLVDLHHSAG